MNENDKYMDEHDDEDVGMPAVIAPAMLAFMLAGALWGLYEYASGTSTLLRGWPLLIQMMVWAAAFGIVGTFVLAGILLLADFLSGR